MFQIKIGLLLLSAGAALAWAQSTPYQTLEDLKKIKGFQKLLEKGRIPAIYKPQFVPGRDADMPMDAWVIGVADGQHAKAYSINLLNRHEIVNDFIGEKPIATTW